MRRSGLVMLSVGLLVLSVGAVATMISGDAEPQVDPYTKFVTAHLDVVAAGPEVAVPDARFSRTIHADTDLDGVDPALDACAGPVAVDLGDGHPVLVAEHDYCGGSAWIPKLESDDVVGLRGPGVEPGLYTAGEIKYVPRQGSQVEDLPDGDVVLQTCVSRSTMVLVALDIS